MAEEKAPEGKEAAPAGPKLVMGLPLPIVAFAGINLLLMLGGLGFIVQTALLYKKPPITEEQVVKEIEKKVAKAPETQGVFVEAFPEMTITLRVPAGGRNRYATAEVAIVCASEDCLAQVKGNKAKVEDAIQSAVSGRSYNELGSLEVKFRVKHEILGRVNSFLKDTAATDVLFTNFLVQ